MISRWVVGGLLHIALLCAIVLSTQYHAINVRAASTPPRSYSTPSHAAEPFAAVNKLRGKPTNLFVTSKSAPGFPTNRGIPCGSSIQQACPSLSDALETASNSISNTTSDDLVIILAPTKQDGCTISRGEMSLDSYNVNFSTVTVKPDPESNCTYGIKLSNESTCEASPVAKFFSLTGPSLNNVSIQSILFPAENGVCNESPASPHVLLSFQGYAGPPHITFQNCTFQVGAGCSAIRLEVSDQTDVRILYKACKFIGTEPPGVPSASADSVITLDSSDNETASDAVTDAQRGAVSLEMVSCEIKHISLSASNEDSAFITYRTNSTGGSIKLNVIRCNFSHNVLSHIFLYQAPRFERISMEIRLSVFEWNTVRRLFHGEGEEVYILISKTSILENTTLGPVGLNSFVSVQSSNSSIRIQNSSFNVAGKACTNLATFIYVTGGPFENATTTIRIEDSRLENNHDQSMTNSRPFIWVFKARIILSGRNVIRGDYNSSEGPILSVGGTIEVNGILDTNFDSSFIQRLNGTGALIDFRNVTEQLPFCEK
ncbi:uncharacterized protein LOC135820095 [Sycon ciliatum]|uniref:uncharacterized protein LOC135820095 n=1 Tax=Sycon ciliatum TaxID=27933 RepID=UPI0031F6B589